MCNRNEMVEVDLSLRRNLLTVSLWKSYPFTGIKKGMYVLEYIMEPVYSTKQ